MLTRRLVVVLVLAVLAWAVWKGTSRPPDLSELQADADRAAALYDAGEWTGSAELYLSAAAGAREAGADDLATAWSAQAGVGLKMAGDTVAARPLLEGALARARETGDRRTEGLALGNLARVAGLERRLDEAQEHLDGLAELARVEGDPALQVKTLEQAADTALARGDHAGARERLEQALEIDARLEPDERRHDALMRQLAWVAVEAGDDEGAAAIWLQVPASAAATANQARHLSRLGLHQQAADLAREAAALLEDEGERRRPARDRALALAASSLLRDRQMKASHDMLRTLTDVGGDPLAMAPFEVLLGRHAMARQDWDRALDHFDAVMPLLEDLDDGVMLPWLRAAALCYGERYPEARLLLLDNARRSRPDDGRPYDTVTAWLLGWSLVQQPAGDGSDDALLTDVALSLAPDVGRPIDPRVAELRELCPQPLPSLAWTVLEVYLAQAASVRVGGGDEVARGTIRRGAHDALVWQAREACDAVRPGLLPSAANLPRLRAWVEGRLDDDEAIIAVIAGETRGYVVLSTSDLGATTIGIPPRFTLRAAMGEVVEALRGEQSVHLESASHKLTKLIIGKKAQFDLARRNRWTMILPDDVTPVPPALWVLDEPIDGVPTRWLVESHVTALLPHALAGGDGLREAANWAQMAAPIVDRAALPLSTARMVERFGEGALLSNPGRSVPVTSRWTESEATTVRLRSAHGSVDVLELSVPALGGGRLGGLLFSPLLDPDEAVTTYGDERLGFMPWHRFPEVDLPPSLVLGQSRFDPGDPEHGANFAATALMQSSDRLLMTRWPLARVPSEMILEWFSRGVRGSRPEQPISYAAALAAAQRVYLVQARENGAVQLQHPRAWAGWLVYGTN